MADYPTINKIVRHYPFMAGEFEILVQAERR